MRKKGLIFVISGPSGSGKTTLIKNLLKDKKLSQRITKSVSFTTRPQRSNERNKKDYFFITSEQFRDLLKRKKIIEWTRYLDYYYGTPKDYLDAQLKKKKNIVLCLDIKGALSIKRIYPRNTVTIFILPPQIGALRQRICVRTTDIKKENLFRRLNLADKEITASSRYDYRVVNDVLTLSLRQLKDIIMKRIDS
jgi:guanylate kinase